MGSIVFGALAPHPPIIIAAVGGEERNKAYKTIQAMEEFARDLVGKDPETVVFISPHGPVFEDGIVILGGESLSGDFARFNAPQLKYHFSNDLELAHMIVEEAQSLDVFSTVADREGAGHFNITLELDHGVLVPLEFIREAGFSGKIVVMGMAMLPPDQLYEFGMAIQRAIEKTPGRVAVIASGDMSHRLTAAAPAGYNRRGQEFDLTLEENLKGGDFARIMDMEPELVEGAGECGYRPLNILLGVFDAYRVKTRVYSYEGPFGVGYLCVSILPSVKEGVSGTRVAEFRRARAERLGEQRGRRHPLVALAAKSLEHYLRTGESLKQSSPLPAGLPSRAGVFVSIKRHGQLRGCIGTISPTQQDLAQEVICNAVSAGTGDPRFFPIELEELPQLEFSVDVLGEEEPVAGPEYLDPQRYGVIVRSGKRSGLLLPNLAGIDTVSEQLRIACQKAGIEQKEKVELSRFEVERYT